jgi:hypothetical protein
METAAVEELRSRIVSEIGRDSVLITSDDKQRHFDGVSFVAYYAGALFIAFVTAAGKRLWEKIKEQSEKAGERVVDAGWDLVAEKLSKASDDAADESDTNQIERIKEASSGLHELSTELTSHYITDFLAAGEKAVEAHLRQDHFSEAKAKRIAAVVTLEVRKQIAGAET